MSGPAPISETRHGVMLAEFASLALAAARMAHERMVEAETAEDFAKLSQAADRMHRSGRLSLALEAKLVRDQEHDAANLREHRERTRKDAISRRRTQVHNAVADAVWRETDSEEMAHDKIGDLFDLLESEAHLESFLEEPADVQIARLRHMLDADHERLAPTTPGEDDDAEPFVPRPITVIRPWDPAPATPADTS